MSTSETENNSDSFTPTDSSLIEGGSSDFEKPKRRNDNYDEVNEDSDDYELPPAYESEHIAADPNEPIYLYHEASDYSSSSSDDNNSLHHSNYSFADNFTLPPYPESKERFLQQEFPPQFFQSLEHDDEPPPFPTSPQPNNSFSNHQPFFSPTGSFRQEFAVSNASQEPPFSPTFTSPHQHQHQHQHLQNLDPNLLEWPSIPSNENNSRWSLIRHFSMRQLPAYQREDRELPTYESAVASGPTKENNSYAPAAFNLRIDSTKFFTQELFTPVLSTSGMFNNRPSAPPLSASHQGTMRLSHAFQFPTDKKIRGSLSTDSSSLLERSASSSTMTGKDGYSSPVPSSPMPQSPLLSPVFSPNSSFSSSSNSTASSVDISLKSTDGLSLSKKQSKDASLESLNKTASENSRTFRHERNNVRKQNETRDKEMNIKHSNEIKQLEQNIQNNAKLLSKERSVKEKETMKRTKASKAKSIRLEESSVEIPKEITLKQLTDSQKESQKWIQDYLAIEELENSHAFEISQLKIVISEKVKRFKERVTLDFSSSNALFMEERRQTMIMFEHALQVLDRKHEIHLEDLDERFQTSNAKLTKMLSSEKKKKTKEFKLEEKMIVKQESEAYKQRSTYQVLDKSQEKANAKMKKEERLQSFNRSIQESEEQSLKTLQEQYNAEKCIIIAEDRENRSKIAAEMIEKEFDSINEHFNEMHTRSRTLLLQLNEIVDADFESLLMILEGHLEEATLKHEQIKKNYVVLINYNYTFLANALREAMAKKIASAIKQKEEIQAELLRHENLVIQMQWENTQQKNLLSRINKIELDFIDHLVRLMEGKNKADLEVVNFYFEETQSVSLFFFQTILEFIHKADEQRAELEDRYQKSVGIMPSYRTYETELERAQVSRDNHVEKQIIAKESVDTTILGHHQESIKSISNSKVVLENSQKQSEENLEAQGRRQLENLHKLFCKHWSGNPKMTQEMKSSSLLNQLFGETNWNKE